MKTLLKIAVIMGFIINSDVYAYGNGREHNYHGYYKRHSHYDWVEKRQARQYSRIEEGIYYGQLTVKEVKKLHKKQNKIGKLKRRFKRDGYFTKQERYIINHYLDKASERIYQFKHNHRYRKHSYVDYDDYNWQEKHFELKHRYGDD